MKTDRIRASGLVGTLACLLTTLATIEFVPAQVEALPGKATPEEIQLLIKQLGAESFEAREMATKSLIALESQALPWVKEALRSTDEEVKVRASRIVVEIGRQIDRKRVNELFRKLNIDQDFDRLIAQLVRGEDNDLRNWQALYQLVQLAAKQINDEINDQAKRPFAMPFDDVARLEPGEQAKKGLTARNARIAFDKIPPPTSGLLNCMLVGNGDVNNLNTVSGSIVVLKGSINRCLGVRNSILICREINTLLTATDSLIITSGKIGRASTLTNSYIAATQLEFCSTIRNSTFINFSKVPDARFNDAGVTIELKTGAIPIIQSMFAHP
jgi:hypothetical protein